MRTFITFLVVYDEDDILFSGVCDEDITFLLVYDEDDIIFLVVCDVDILFSGVYDEDDIIFSGVYDEDDILFSGVYDEDDILFSGVYDEDVIKSKDKKKVGIVLKTARNDDSDSEDLSTDEDDDEKVEVGKVMVGWYTQHAKWTNEDEVAIVDEESVCFINLKTHTITTYFRQFSKILK